MKNYSETEITTEKWWESYYSKIKGVDIPSSILIVLIISLEYVYPFQSSQFNVTRICDEIYITEVECMIS